MELVWLGFKDEVIAPGHPEHHYWMEEAAILDWIEDGAPPVDPVAPVKPVAPAAPVPRFTVTRKEAADAFGVSVDYFEAHILPELKVLAEPGRKQLIPVRVIEDYLEANSARALR